MLNFKRSKHIDLFNLGHPHEAKELVPLTETRKCGEEIDLESSIMSSVLICGFRYSFSQDRVSYGTESYLPYLRNQIKWSLTFHAL